MGTARLLLLPGLLGTARLLLLPGLLGTLSSLLLWLRLLPSLLLGLSGTLSLLLLLRLGPLPLLLCGSRRTIVLLILTLLNLALFLVLLVALRVCGDNRPEKQKQGRGTGSSDKLHGNRLLQGLYWICTPTASPS